MKILFSMRHSGALRNFASTIRSLAESGHEIHLVFMMADKRGDGRLLRELTEAHPGITSAQGPDPKARRFWTGLQRAVRTGGDYIRYWTDDYATANALRDRAAARVPASLRSALDRRIVRTRTGLALTTRAFRALERAMPVDRRVLETVAASEPDVVLVTPLVDLGSDQVEYVKAARALGIPCGLAVHSWDNLTNKGVLRLLPDRIFVWNDAQKQEAVVMHGAPPASVVVTGAPVYDQWFSRRPSTARDEFCRKAGLRPDVPFLLYLCSSAFIAADEAAFVTRWIAAVRSSSDPGLRSAGILIRPHPDNPWPWQQFDASAFPNVAVWPRGGVEPIDAGSRNDYFDSIYHSAAAIGINTSAQIEAGIVGRPVYSFRASEYAATQEGTLHFHYLVNHAGGLLRVADTIEGHVAQLAAALRAGDGEQERLTGFVAAFVRPHGLDVPATPRLAAAIEDLGAGTKVRVPQRPSAAALAGRVALYPVAAVMNIGVRRTVKRKQAAHRPAAAPARQRASTP